LGRKRYHALRAVPESAVHPFVVGHFCVNDRG
jgi:hypothetical protein